MDDFDKPGYRSGPSSRPEGSQPLRQDDDEQDISDVLPSGHHHQHSRNSSIRSIQEDAPIDLAYRDDDRQQITSPQRLAPPSPNRLAPLSTMSNIVRRMTTMKSPITGTRFRTIRRQKQYETLDEGDEAAPGPVDISSLEGLGYELRDMSPTRNANTRLDEEETEYVSPSTSRQPKFLSRSRVSQHRAKDDGIGDGMNQIGAQLRRNPTKAPARAPSARDDAANAIDRQKTVRNLGRKLASEKNTIVVMNDSAVDLSQYEGPQSISFRSSTASFDGIVGNRASTFGSITAQDENKSYFFPTDPDVPNWKPFPMKTYWIVILIVLAVAIAAGQEALCQSSIRNHDEHGAIIRFNDVKNVPTLEFFAWKYLPTMIAVMYSVLFNIMDFEIRRLEPYYQLSQPQGATAATSLNCDHLTMFQYFVPFKAFRLGQWAVLLSTTGNILASMVGPAVQNPALRFVENSDESCEDGSLNPKGPCGNGEFRMWVKVDPVWSRLLTVSYLLIAVIGIVLVFQLRRKSGLLSDPKGIAGIASMATKSHILRDFNGTDEATRGQLHKRLQHRRYVLYKSSIWQGEYSQEDDPAVESDMVKLKNPQPPMLRQGAALSFMGFMVFGLITIPLISLTPARIIPNEAPWLPILLATLLKLLFNTFEADIRLMEPYYVLSRGQAKPEHCLTLDYQASIYGWMPIQALMNRHWLVMLVGISSVALDIFTVTVGSFSVNSVEFLHREDGDETSNQDETYVSFYTSLVLSLAILLFVLVTTALVWWRRRHPFLPREPSTIAANLAFIYSSNMLTDFIDTERFNNKQMQDKLKRIGKTYALGWFRGRDGEIHCAIDEEPLVSRYVHGKPYSRSQAAPSGTFGEPDWEFVGDHV